MDYNYELIYTAQFKEDFREIGDYFIEKFAHKDLITNLDNQISIREHLLVKFPKSFPIFESNVFLEHEYRSYNVGGYKVFYYIDELLKKIYIKRILHGSVDLKNVPI